MRSLLLEVIAIVLLSIILVCATLGMMPGELQSTWWSRTSDLLVTAFTLDFESARWAQPSAFSVILSAALRSVTIIGMTVAILLLIGVPLGIVSATRSDSPGVQMARRILSTVTSLPVLVLGTVIYVVFARSGMTLREDSGLAGAMVAVVVVLAFGDRLLADITQRVELGARTILAEPYMRAVRAANLGFRRHLLQSLVPPVAEAVTSRSMFLISGAIVAELVFAVHGLGYTVEHALEDPNGDQTLVLASTMALIAIGLGFRVMHRSALALADARRRG